MWVLILTELVKFLAALIAGGAFGFVAASSNSEVVNQVASSDGMFSGVIWAGVGGLLVYLWMSGFKFGGVLRFIFGLLKKGTNAVVTEWRAS